MKNNKKSIVNDNVIKILPLALILLIVPMIVFMRSVPVEGIADNFYSAKSANDFFSYYKTSWFIAFTVVSIFFALHYLFVKKIKVKSSFFFVPLLIYFLFVFLSSSFSEYHDVAFNGFIDRFEGFWTISCYIIVCLIAAHFITYDKDIKLLFGSLGICSLILCLLGLSQFFGFDFLQTNFMKHVMLPQKYENLISSLNFKFPEKYVYLTLFNPNYVGSFCALVLPICIVILLLSKNKYMKIISGSLSALLLANLIFSRSTTGYIGVFVALLCLVVLLRKRIFKYWLPVLALILCCTGVFTYLNYSYSGIITKELINLLPKKQASIGLVHGKYKNITDMTLNKNKMTIYMNSTPINVIFDTQDSTLSFLDNDGKAVNYRANPSNKNHLLFDQTNFIGLQLNINNSVLAISSPRTIYYVTIDDTGSFKFLNSGGNPVDIETAESFGFQGYETWASSRGYIWSRTIPLLKDTVLLGHGPDTYAIYFPQNDFKGKLITFSSPNTLVDKPHNMYLQMAINTGLVSLLAFLVFVLWYIINSFKLYFNPKNSDSFYYMAGSACLLSVIGFLVVGLANDSNINVSPIFWIILGIGFASNRLYMKEIH
ncbi:O-antigen ligase-like membrane protein [Ruminiclostridium sufflavum DSM 19573]|uniref:O-antigen ligase-like membrane protein n=1 Tax=Ruminiclostridium sufflavum DSM 19573 TaxID=1121337 RepID=A0A318XNK5_9FIRM|nr:O-antigen ligase family protein [Ruminiclostridium sufflavum]PYG87159.1 O-antigen ligase-like membrane protein [Ruminiclostridium sufflavum DSM 19573]